jgi:hypothetical protein
MVLGADGYVEIPNGNPAVGTEGSADSEPSPIYYGSIPTGTKLMRLPIGSPEFVGSNPASPISRYSGEVVPSEEVPEEWCRSWVGQFAKESLLGWDCDDSVFSSFFLS